MSKIEWTDRSLNPITGCTSISPGCNNCYARRMANRHRGRFGYPSDDPFRVTYHPDKVIKPLSWRKPVKIFLCSMSDMFHPQVPDEWRDEIWAVMAICAMHERPKGHTFQILTKRPERMKDYVLSLPERRSRIAMIAGKLMEDGDAWHDIVLYHMPDVLPNAWLGATCENQEWLEKRLRFLLETPAALHFLSYEPALGPIDLNGTSMGQILGPCDECGERKSNPDCEACAGFPSLGWVIVGGENGPGARLMDPIWAAKVLEQCQSAGVPFFFKGRGYIRPNVRANKRILYDREWNQFPEVRND